MITKTDKKISTLFGALGVVLTGLILWADISSPQGVAWGFVYVVVVLLTLWMRGMMNTLLFSVVSVLLTLFALLIKPPGTEMYIVLTNRFLSVGSILITFVGILIYKRRERLIHQQQEVLLRLTEELKLSNSDLEQFAYVASHDLQEPLRKIQSFGDRLVTTEREKLSETGKDYLSRMMNASSRMQTLIDDLLTYSRLSSRHSVFTTVDLNEVLKEVQDDLEHSIEKSGARIEASGLPHLPADRTQIRQLFQNLLSNSIKFRKENEAPVIRITSCVTEGQRTGNEVSEIRFTDNGIGFDNKYSEKIFQFFQRLEGKKYEGSGIGLAVCRKIAARHGGSISVHSETGQGTTFTIRLPLGSTRSNT
ncbi:MAG: hypothetical protein IT233_04645 [Bacteroidia bacterium]|nr:hypothetical protein [Bacteroidia bacterium]